MSNKPKRGPRPRPDAVKKSAFFTIRMTESERAEIDTAVSYDQGAWARKLLLAAARRILGKTGAKTDGQ